ncbi:MAG: LolA family protein [Methyloceanibacter sp.]
MTSRRAVAFVFGLPFAFALAAVPALAQDGSTTIRKTPVATGSVVESEEAGPEDALRPSLGEEAIAGGDGTVSEMTPSEMDEGASWEAAVSSDAPTPLIGEAQDEAVKRINAYFNSITNLQGKFEQVDPNNKTSAGRFYVQRPGKIRFDYAPPSGLRIIADGHSLAIEDSDLKTVEKYPIKSTPFRLLLADSVDLARDARIIGVEGGNGILAISLEDKGGDAAGRIRLSFATKSDLELKEWLITDAQGLTTKVTVTDVVSGRKVAVDFFQSKDSFEPFR